MTAKKSYLGFSGDPTKIEHTWDEIKLPGRRQICSTCGIRGDYGFSPRCVSPIPTFIFEFRRWLAVEPSAQIYAMAYKLADRMPTPRLKDDVVAAINLNATEQCTSYLYSGIGDKK